MARFTPIDLSFYPISDVLEVLDFESYLARDRAEFESRWAIRRATNPELPAYDTLFLETDPSSINLQVGAYREMLLRGFVNDKVRNLTLAGALGPALDHIGITYYRTPRRVAAPATETEPAVMEDDETYRQRLSIAPESWSTAGPVGAYLFWALSASEDVLDVAVYSEDEGTCLAPRVRVAVMSKSDDGVAPAGLLTTVLAKLNRDDIRPMADLVTVEPITPLDYSVEIALKLKTGASQAIIEEQARLRVLNYCSGRLRWIGDGEVGPVWLVGRRIRQDTIAAAAYGADPNIVEVDVVSPAGDVNPPHIGYTDDALAGVGSPSFVPLSESVIAHLFTAPRVTSVTVTSEIVSGAWS